MKLDATDLRYITSDEFRVLTAVEMGSKNHEVVPNQLIAQISGLRNGGINKLLGSLAKRNLIAKVQNTKYEGYRLTYGGYDYLAMRTLSKRETMHSVGNQIGVGKESDIYVVADAEGQERVLKLHRLGRISFRSIKNNRDYLGKRKSASWMYMSRLAAQKEWAFMKVLHEHGFPVPTPIDQARHCILMELIDAYPLRQISDHPNPGQLYSTLMDLIVRFARAGLIHGDFNEFNILIRRETGEPVVIDFPQMVSTSHANAEWYFNRDVECIRTFFRRRFRYESVLYPRFKRTLQENADGEDFRLDVIVEASGFSKKEEDTLHRYMESVQDNEGHSVDEEGEGDEEDEEEGEEEEEEGEDDDDDKEEIEEEQDENDGTLDATVQRGETSNRRQPKVIAASAEADEDLPARLDLLSINPSDTASKEDSATKDGVEEDQDSSGDNTSEDETKRIKERVASDVSRQRAKQQRKYHTGKGAKRVGRPKGSKAKTDDRVKASDYSGWD